METRLLNLILACLFFPCIALAVNPPEEKSPALSGHLEALPEWGMLENKNADESDQVRILQALPDPVAQWQLSVFLEDFDRLDFFDLQGELLFSKTDKSPLNVEEGRYLLRFHKDGWTGSRSFELR